MAASLEEGWRARPPNHNSCCCDNEVVLQQSVKDGGVSREDSMLQTSRRLI